MNSQELAKYIDHTLLTPEATLHDISVLCQQANTLKVAAVCFSSSFLPLELGQLDPNIAVACVIDFPSGAQSGAVKAFEAANAVKNGAGEIDMVVNLSFVLDAKWLELGDEISIVRKNISSSTILKVIIESAALTDEQIIMTCRVAVASGANFVKTSTGFHKSGGASLHAVALMRSVVGPTIGVKASGGIRDRQTALAMIGAGASRLGTSATTAILRD